MAEKSIKIVDPFLNVDEPPPAQTESERPAYLSQVKEYRLGAGNTAIKMDRNGLFAGNREFSKAPFSVTPDGVVKGIGNTAVGNFTVTATGGFSVSGLGFKPNGLMIQSVPQNAAGILPLIGFVGKNVNQRTQNYDNVTGVYDLVKSNRIWSYRFAVGQTGEGSIDSLDDDGFSGTCNFFQAGQNIISTFIAF